MPEPVIRNADRYVRRRSLYVGLLILALVLGLSSRRLGFALPRFVAVYAGDTLWALLVFLGIAWLMRSWSTLRVAIVATLFAAAIETSQLYQASWINAVRGTTLGGLVLGFGFLWSDLVCYAVGIVAGVALDALVRRYDSSQREEQNRNELAPTRQQIAQRHRVE